MSASTRKQPRYYGGLLNLEHRVMSGVVVALAVIVLVLVGKESHAVPGGLQLSVEAPAAEPADDGELDGWVRPREIWVQAPVVGFPVLDERLLRIRFIEPPKLAPPPVPGAVATGVEPVSVPSRPAAVQVDPPEVAAFEPRESLVPSRLRAPDTKASRLVGR